MAVWLSTVRCCFWVFALALLPVADAGGRAKASEAFAAYGDASTAAYSENAVWLRESEDGRYRVPRISGQEFQVVLDTSGSMRDPSLDALRRDVIRRVEVMLQAMTDAPRIRFLDNRGRLIARWPATEHLSSNAPGRADLEGLAKAVASYRLQSDSRFDDGLLAAVKSVRGTGACVLVLGDEYAGREDSVARLTKKLDRRLR